jgi:hypothetical protein
LKKDPSGRASQETLATLTLLILILKTGPAKKASQANLVIPAAVLWCTSWIRRMVKQKSHKAAAAAAQATKDKQFKAFQQELGLLLDKDRVELTPSTLQKAP